MTAPAPKLLADELADAINALLADGRVGDVPAWVARDILLKAERLAKEDVVAADRIRLALALRRGDGEEVQSRLRNMELNGRPDEALAERLWAAANLLRGAEVFALAGELLSKPIGRPLSETVHLLSSAGAFRAATALIAKGNSDMRVTQGTPDIRLSREAASLLDELGISDETIAATMSELGGLLGEHKLLWLGNKVDTWVAPPDNLERGLLMQYPVAVTPTGASELSWELSERLVAKDLAYPGFAIALIGVSQPSALAA